MFFLSLSAPWQETPAEARDGDGDGGGAFRNMSGPFWDHFRTPILQNYVFQPKINFLEMAHTNFFSSI